MGGAREKQIPYGNDRKKSKGKRDLRAAAVADGEFVGGVGWEEVGYQAQACGQGRGGEERVLALAEFAVVEVECQREQIDGDRVGEGGLEVEAALFLVDDGLRGGAGLGGGVELRDGRRRRVGEGALAGGDGREGAAVAARCGLEGLGLRIGGAAEGEVAGLPRVHAGLSSHIVEGLFPDKIGEGFGDASLIDKGVRDVDEELEAEGEAVAHEAGGDEDASLAVAELDVAVADGGLRELVGVGAGDHGGLGCFGLVAGEDVGVDVESFGGFAQGERDEVVGVGVECGRDGGGDGLEHTVEIEVGNAGFAVGGEANAVGGLADGGIVRNFDGSHKM